MNETYAIEILFSVKVKRFCQCSINNIQYVHAFQTILRFVCLGMLRCINIYAKVTHMQMYVCILKDTDVSYLMLICSLNMYYTHMQGFKCPCIMYCLFAVIWHFFSFLYLLKLISFSHQIKNQAESFPCLFSLLQPVNGLSTRLLLGPCFFQESV